MRKLSFFLFALMTFTGMQAQTLRSASINFFNCTPVEQNKEAIVLEADMPTTVEKVYIQKEDFGDQKTHTYHKTLHGVGADCDTALTLVVTKNTCPLGALDSKFTINSKGDKVYFSKGNLQWRACEQSGKSEPDTHIGPNGLQRMGHWRFAPNQWEHSLPNRPTTNELKTTTNWIEYFRFGTSGWEEKNNQDQYVKQYYPYWITSSPTSPSRAYPEDERDLTGEYANADWGRFNKIEDAGDYGDWRTLTQDEWDYILNKRTMPNNGRRVCYAVVNNTPGMLIYPDDYCLSYTNIMGQGAHENYFYSSDFPDDQKTTHSTYKYNIREETWDELESHGVVFLRRTGYWDPNYSYLQGDTRCFYWTSTACKTYSSWSDRIGVWYETYNTSQHYIVNMATYFRAVRLVQDVK